MAFTKKSWIPSHQRPNDLALILWRDGRCVTWDVTVSDTIAASYLSLTCSYAGSAAEAAATRKEEKYSEITSNYLFFPLAFETFGPINQTGCNFLSSLGHRLTLVSDDPREFYFLFQRLSISIQRFNHGMGPPAQGAPATKQLKLFSVLINVNKCWPL